jgi:nuclear cap-binding protein subunit 1
MSRLTFNADDDREERRDERPARRNRYEEPPASKLRREILVIGETPSRNPIHEAASLGKRIAELFDDDQVHGPFVDTLIELIIEQPFKVPHIAAVVLYANDLNGAVAQEVLVRSAEKAQDAMEDGLWREFKLIMRLFACMQSLYEGDGIFAMLDELFNRAVDQQTASPEDMLGLELIKVILYSLPYAMASAATGLEEKAKELLERTEIIASVQHLLEDLANPYPIENDARPFSFVSALDLLQKQLVNEEEGGWKLSCLPRLYQPNHAKQTKEGNGDTAMGESNGHVVTKHAFPVLNIPTTLNPGRKPLFPETYFSAYTDQEIESVPRPSNISALLIRDAVVDTINILSFNRMKVANFLIELDCFFAPGTFAPRATPFDKLREIESGASTWKPEDVIVDAIFSQVMRLPSAEHKLVYYHSVITEACKIAPAAIAPTLGRAIRFLYKNVDYMDLELTYRFVDWFTHHLSNFDFRWKWSEWSENVDGADLDPKKAFIVGAIDKEIRLSFAKRISETLPPDYRKLITEGMFKDTPDFKFENDSKSFMSLIFLTFARRSICC